MGLTFALCFACNTVGVKDAYMALDAEGNRKRDVFYTDTEAIYCVLEMASGVSDVTVVTKLRLLRLYDEFGGDPIEYDTIVGAEESAPGVGENLRVSYLLEPPTGLGFYPAGEYVCELYIDGTREAKLKFEVRFPECPFAPIEADAPCAGIVLRGARCPSPAGERCRCEKDTGLWACP